MIENYPISIPVNINTFNKDSDKNRQLRLCVAGSRSISDKEFIFKYLDNFIKKYKLSNIEIVSGLANGPDKIGIEYANERDYTYVEFPAKWKEYGKSAGYKRNVEMAEYSDVIILFYDGISKGTKHMENICVELKKPVICILYKTTQLFK